MRFSSARLLEVVIAAARIGLGILFAYAAAEKLKDLPGFAEDIANYRMLPAALVGPLAVVLPGVELTVGALLILGCWSRAAAAVTAAMLVVFIVGLSQALARGVDLNCGCFGSGVEPVSVGTIVRDAVLLLAAGGVIVFDGGRLLASKA
jgi:putative oxidoreductase